ncbi:MAG: hypothetical protein P4M11_14640 [Candidatus Pacebacteria bacterium]|nr:hypothetical protein [Candidatus Paceibacterota bacterium]
MAPLSMILATWIPYILLCFTLFVLIAFRSFKLISKSRTIRRTWSLLLLYTAINIGLFCCPFERVQVIFPDSEAAAIFSHVVHVVEDDSLYVIIFAFLARVVGWEVKVSRKKAMLAMISYVCWALLILYVLMHPIMEFVLTGSQKLAYYVLSFTVIFAMNAVVFLIMALEYHSVTQSHIFFSEKVLTCYFLTQTLPHLMYIINELVDLSNGKTVEPDSVWNTVGTYMYTLLYDIMPPVLIFVMISKLRSPMSKDKPSANTSLVFYHSDSTSCLSSSFVDNVANQSILPHA